MRNHWLYYLNENPELHKRLLAAEEEEKVSSLSGEEQAAYILKQSFNIDVTNAKPYQVAMLGDAAFALTSGQSRDQKNIIDQTNDAKGVMREKVLLAQNKKGASKLLGQKTLLKILSTLDDPKKAFAGARWPEDDHLIFDAAYKSGYKAESIMKEFLQGETDLEDIPMDIKKHVGRNIRGKKKISCRI